MLIGLSFVAAGFLMLAIGWRQIYYARRYGRLATSGLYHLVRHPQYTGIFLAVFGQLVHWPTIPTLVLSPFIFWAYVRLARREEARLIEKFGDVYRAYQREVPMLLPRPSVLVRQVRS